MSLFGSDRPSPRLKPLEVARDTFVVRGIISSVGTTFTNMNSMVIRGAEPLVADTGMVTDRANWFDDVFSLVRPEEVRWIFISHTDSDHSGNLVEAHQCCPNATIVTSRPECYRTSASFGIPLERIRMVDDGEAFDLGDRVLRIVRPPVYDSPYTRGLFDPATRVFYSSDAFCAPMPNGPVDRVDEIEAPMWAEGMARFHHSSLCPWIGMVDQTRFRAEVDKLARLGIETIVGAHTPVIPKSHVATAFEQLARLPSAVPAPLSFAEVGER